MITFERIGETTNKNLNMNSLYLILQKYFSLTSYLVVSQNNLFMFEVSESIGENTSVTHYGDFISVENNHTKLYFYETTMDNVFVRYDQESNPSYIEVEVKTTQT